MERGPSLFSAEPEEEPSSVSLPENEEAKETPVDYTQQRIERSHQVFKELEGVAWKMNDPDFVEPDGWYFQEFEGGYIAWDPKRIQLESINTPFDEAADAGKLKSELPYFKEFMD